MTMGQVLFRMLITFVIILVYMKLSSNLDLAPLTAMDQIGNIVMGALAGGIITQEVNSLMLIVTLCGWGGLLLLVRVWKYKSVAFSTFLDGRRTVLVKNEKLIPAHFQKTKLSAEDFILDLHQQEILSLDQVENVWLEPSGELTVDKKGEKNLSRLLIANGVVDPFELQGIGKDKDWLEGQLKERGFAGAKEIFIAEWHEDQLWLYPY